MQANKNRCAEGRYILLDWNVIQYLKNPRKDKNDLDVDCLNIRNFIKKYEFPFCEAHLQDLARSNPKLNKEAVQGDLHFLEQLSRRVAIGWDANNDICFKADCSPFDLFNNIIQNKAQELNITPDIVPSSISKIDMQRIDASHPLRAMLEKTDGVIGPGIFSDWLNNLYDRILNENIDYKKIRDYVKKELNQIIAKSSCLDSQGIACWEIYIEHMTPFADSLVIQDEEELATIWKRCIEKWLHMNNEVEIPFGLLITTAYSMLDFHPLFSEKLKNKKNTIGNIVRDSKTIYYASYAKYFVTEDKACHEKSKFLFQAFQLKTKAINMSQFRAKFS